MPLSIDADVTFEPLDFQYLQALSDYVEGTGPVGDVVWGLTIMVRGERYGVVFIRDHGDFYTIDGYTLVRGRYALSVSMKAYHIAKACAPKDKPARIWFSPSDLRVKRLCDIVGCVEVYRDTDNLIMEV